jgi:NAD(P)H-flavin reductase
LENSHARVIPCLTQPEKIWKGFKGRVTDYLRAETDLVRWARTDFYLCGNPAMVEQVRAFLQACGVSARAIRSECFRGAVAAAASHGPLVVSASR